MDIAPASRTRIRKKKNILPLSKKDFMLFQTLLIDESGLYFDKDKSRSLQLALWERVQKRGHGSYREYYNLLKFHPEGRLEISDLLDLITIGETYFFRNRPHFEALMKFVLPEIIRKKISSKNRSLRIWSAGCSRGDEPYSIAMAVMEVLPSYKNWDISILGTDINKNALANAKEAVYGRKDTSRLSGEYLDKYFQVRGTNYILDNSVKKLVRFESHNLASDPFTIQQMRNLDIIFCRNVTIYFNFQTTKQITEKFYDCLSSNSYLFIGHAETLWQITNKFKSVEFPQTFIYKKALQPVEETAMRPFMSVPEINLEEFVHSTANIGFVKTQISGENFFSEEAVFSEAAGDELEEKADQFQNIAIPSQIKAEEEFKALHQEAAIFFNEKKYDEALLRFDKIIAKDKNNITAYFAKANVLANQAKYEEAINALANIIKADNLYVEAYYLLGVLLYKTENFSDAVAHFRKVIYVDPEIVLAYYNLGNIYLYQKKFSKAGREFNNVITLLETKPENEKVKFCEDFTVDSILQACRNRLKEIKKHR